MSDPLRVLIAKWRSRSAKLREYDHGDPEGALAMGDYAAESTLTECADELEALLSAGVPPQDEAMKENNDDDSVSRGRSLDVVPATGSPRSPQPDSSPRWHPIETAPENESILIYLPNWEHYGAAIYRAIHVNMGTGRRWHTTGWSVGRDLEAGYPQPTHWMPVPSPPARESE